MYFPSNSIQKWICCIFKIFLLFSVFFSQYIYYISTIISIYFNEHLVTAFLYLNLWQSLLCHPTLSTRHIYFPLRVFPCWLMRGEHHAGGHPASIRLTVGERRTNSYYFVWVGTAELKFICLNHAPLAATVKVSI